ncbi:hypothetical protein [Mumia sp. Pv 4-285]|uniref:hypothetical protein n=1 Tax=Mumia qirimensis TaxID=3234852 RepID=UPI00351D3CC8
MAHPDRLTPLVLEDLMGADVRPPKNTERPEVDPLVDADAMEEAQLLDVRIDALRRTVGLLFELRVAMNLRHSDVAVVIAHGVRDFAFEPHRWYPKLTAWSVGIWTPSASNEYFNLEFGMDPDADCRLVADRACFYGVEVPGLPANPPDYTTYDDDLIRSGLPSWQSQFTLVNATTFEGAQ